MSTSASYRFSHPIMHAGLLPWQWLFLFFILGLFALRFPVPALSGALILGLLQLKLSKSSIKIWKISLAFLLGTFAAWWALPDMTLNVPGWMKHRKKVQISGIVQEVTPKPENTLQIILRQVKYTRNKRAKDLPAKLVWKWKNPRAWPAPGQKIEGIFRIKPVHGYFNPGTWDRRFYWALREVKYRTFTKGDKALVNITGRAGILWNLRKKLRNNIIDYTSNGVGQGLLLALILGDKSRLSYDSLDLVRRASLAHSLALSGLHLGFMVSLGWILAWLAGRLKPDLYLLVPRQRLMIYIAVPLMIIYIWMGQFRPSLLRAGLMFFFWGFLYLQGKRKVLLDGLFFALLVIVLISPLTVFDLGLQLSVTAVAGIILMWPVYSHYAGRLKGDSYGKKLVLSVLSLLAVSVMANLALLPVIAWNFGQLSFHVYLNLLWIPALGFLVLPLGFVGLALSILPGLGFAAQWLLQAAAWVNEFLVYFLQVLDEHDFLQILVPMRPRWPEMFGYWILLGLVVLWWKRLKKIPWWGVGLGIFLLLGPGLVREIGQAQNDLRLKVLDMGQGQSICLDYPGGRRILVDGGGSWNPEFDLGRYALAPALTWGRAPKLESVVLTHPDFDHMRGLYYILEHFSVQEFAYNGKWPGGWDGAILRDTLRDNDIHIQVWRAGDRIAMGQGLSLEVIYPGKGSLAAKENNNTSLVLRIVYKGKGLALLTGDVEKSAINEILQRDLHLKADVLMVPHHGSRSSLSTELYRKVDPDLAVACCGYLNHYHFPHPSVCKALRKLNIPLMTTAQNGAIEVTWDLSTLEMEVETQLKPQRVQ